MGFGFGSTAPGCFLYFVRLADEAARGQKLSTWEDLSLRDLCEAMSATMEQVTVTEKYKPHQVPKPGPMDRVFFAGEEEPTGSRAPE